MAQISQREVIREYRLASSWEDFVNRCLNLLIKRTGLNCDKMYKDKH